MESLTIRWPFVAVRALSARLHYFFVERIYIYILLKEYYIMLYIGIVFVSHVSDTVDGFDKYTRFKAEYVRKFTQGLDD